VVRPDPIPNSEVKRSSADDSCRATGRENMSPPEQCLERYKLPRFESRGFLWENSLNRIADTMHFNFVEGGKVIKWLILILLVAILVVLVILILDELKRSKKSKKKASKDSTKQRKE
jgi:hypothetical protein